MQRLLFWLKYTMKNSQSRLLVILTLVISILILSLGLASYVISKSILQKEVALPELTKLTIDRDLTDQFVKNIDMTAVQIILHSATLEFLQSNNDDYNKITNMTDFLNAASISHNIESIYIYDIEKERIAASNPVGYISNMNLLADREWLKDIPSITGMIVKERLNKNRNEMNISLFRPIILNAQKKGILIINIPIPKIFSNQIYIENDLGRSHFVFDAALAPILIKNATDLQETELGDVVKAVEATNHTSFYSNGNKYLLYMLKSDYTNWSFVSVLPEDTLFKGIYWLRNIVLLVSILFAILSVALILITNNKMLGPIRRMRKLLIPIEKTYNEPELLDLEKLTTKILNDHSFMFKQIKTSMPEIRKRFLEDACFEQADSVELYQKWKDHFAEWQQGPLYIAVVSIDHYREWSNRYTPEDSELMLYALGNITQECFNESCLSIMVQQGKEGFYLLLQPKDEDTKELQLIGDRVIAEAQKYLKMSVSIGLSEATRDVLHLSQSYRQSNAALSERLNRGYGQIHIALTQDESQMAEIDEAFIQAINQPLQTGNDSQVWVGVDCLFNAISDIAYSPATAIAALERLQISLEKTAEGFGRPIMAAMKPYFYPKINSMDIHDLRNYFNEIISQILSRFHEKQVSKTNMAIQGLIDYMQEHLSENIGVKDIADSSQISVYQANQLFKQETGQTVYDYLTKLRIEHSEMLLRDTDYKIFEIAEMVGYQNENSFIRVFRNMKNKTPGKYRDWLKEQSE
ncbi:helix-turn-helix domain-containing protein [Paenibacillus agricola]|uniref:Helix-turn-helix transcriptional regulator n=1 Tax=Paenibacillus agricola TaxID=2716264 RepID=A0ABX0J2G6_9BACL|nr:helix-turn-helix domain-containing protein [Paenibacillus agricola]NHN29838.1 helix-turn-helix transcriptional regulator [Paenibacillus agricola]